MYPEQHAYMLSVKRAIDARGHACLEMPTGTGKTIALLSVVTAYQRQHAHVGKLIYCTRTVPEMEKVLAELKNLKQALGDDGAASSMLALGLSSRKNMCIHPGVNDAAARESVDAHCRKLTSPWRRAAAAEHEASASTAPPPETCSFFENYERVGAEGPVPPGVYSLADLREYGRQKHYCPYFLVRHMLEFANVLVYNYQYMLDPKVSTLVSRQLEKEAIVVFDEAHNIDSICIEALSVNIRQQTLGAAARNVDRLEREVRRAKERDTRRLEEEYQRLVAGLRASGALPISSSGNGNGSAGHGVVGTLAAVDIGPSRPIPEEIAREAVPGNIRRAEHFVSFLRRLVAHFQRRLRHEAVSQESPAVFVREAATDLGANEADLPKTLRFCYDRLTSLIRTLEISDADELGGISTVADFATLVGTYTQGFAIIFEPYDERNAGVPDPVLQLCCLDAGLAIRPVFDKYLSVIVTSGTLSPLDLYPKLLGFRPVACESFPMTLTRNCICPLVVTRGADQRPISTAFEMRSDASVVRSYGRLVCDMAAAVPDGLVCFFVSYKYMDSIILLWDEMGVLRELSERKLIFVETTDVVETTLALKNYRRACDCGRGAVFFSVARGKVAEGIDFDRHYGRAVVMFGVPYQYTLSRVLRARLEYLRENFQIAENDFLSFDAIRQASQCVGRVIRSKADYGLMVFADKRYNRRDKRDKLPGWITATMRDYHLNLSTDMGINVARSFMREMAQPVLDAGVGKSLLTPEQIQALGT